jgi:hypothetical protein
MLIYPGINHEYKQDISEWWRNFRNYKYFASLRKEQVSSLYKKTTNNIFDGLTLGNTVTDRENAYVCKITHLLVKVGISYKLIDSKEMGISFEQSYKKKFSQNSKLKVCAVGVKFYNGFTEASDGTFTPLREWNVSGTTNDTNIWFFEPKHVLFLEDIIKFESLVVGDYIEFAKSSGMIITIKELNKPKFFKTCSWSARSIWFIHGERIGLSRMLPDKRFKIISPSTRRK